jgi:hypothetical protein
MTNHEFEKARFYWDEERKQREALTQLQQKHNIPDTHVVTRASILKRPWLDVDACGRDPAGCFQSGDCSAETWRQKTREKAEKEIFLARS